MENIMKPERFTAIARLIRMRGGRSQDAARLVLVEGMRPVDVSQTIGISQQGVCNAVRRIKSADAILDTLKKQEGTQEA
jgi:predicted DNA-binding protein (UPF0251 family)